MNKLQDAKFRTLLGTLIHMHKQYVGKGMECEPLEMALAAALLVEDGDLPAGAAEDMQAIADMFISAEPPTQTEPKSPYVRPKWD